jgi:hypothetical protein
LIIVTELFATYLDIYSGTMKTVGYPLSAEPNILAAYATLGLVTELIRFRKKPKQSHTGILILTSTFSEPQKKVHHKPHSSSQDRLPSIQFYKYLARFLAVIKLI